MQKISPLISYYLLKKYIHIHWCERTKFQYLVITDQSADP